MVWVYNFCFDLTSTCTYTYSSFFSLVQLHMDNFNEKCFNFSNSRLFKFTSPVFCGTYFQVMDNTDVHIVPNTLMIVGLASLGINYFASKICQDALDAGRFPRWKNFLKPYFAISCFFTVLMLLAVIMSFATKGSLESSLKAGLRNGIRFYKDTDTPGRCFQKQNIDRLQMEFRCCGNNDFRDWFEVQWISNRYLDFGSKEVKE